MYSRGSPTRVELCVESLHPSGTVSRLEEIVEQLRELEATDRIDEFDLVVWGDCLTTTTAIAGTDAAERVRERIDACMAWAEATGRTFRPVFRTRDVDNEFTGDSYTAIDLPSMLLVEYEDDAVSHVAPSSDGTSTRSVTDRLRTLAAETREQPPAPAATDAAAHGDAPEGRRHERSP